LIIDPLQRKVPTRLSGRFLHVSAEGSYASQPRCNFKERPQMRSVRDLHTYLSHCLSDIYEISNRISIVAAGSNDTTERSYNVAEASYNTAETSYKKRKSITQKRFVVNVQLIANKVFEIHLIQRNVPTDFVNTTERSYKASYDTAEGSYDTAEGSYNSAGDLYLAAV
jgi:hypothetical protein